jgi:hypothetical protein
MIRIFSQLLATHGDQIVNIQRLPVHIRRPEKVLLLFFKIRHHLRLGLGQVRQVFLNLGAGAVLPLSLRLRCCTLYLWRRVHCLLGATIFVLALFSAESCAAFEHGRIRIPANFPSSRVCGC